MIAPHLHTSTLAWISVHPRRACHSQWQVLQHNTNGYMLASTVCFFHTRITDSERYWNRVDEMNCSKNLTSTQPSMWHGIPLFSATSYPQFHTDMHPKVRRHIHNLINRTTSCTVAMVVESSHTRAITMTIKSIGQALCHTIPIAFDDHSRHRRTVKIVIVVRVGGTVPRTSRVANKIEEKRLKSLVVRNIRRVERMVVFVVIIAHVVGRWSIGVSVCDALVRLEGLRVHTEQTEVGVTGPEFVWKRSRRGLSQNTTKRILC